MGFPIDEALATAAIVLESSRLSAGGEAEADAPLGTLPSRRTDPASSIVSVAWTVATDVVSADRLWRRLDRRRVRRAGRRDG